MKSKLQQQQQETEQVEIPAELVQKFAGDEQLVREFLQTGHSVEELQRSTITHPTKFDPMVELDGNTLGFWIDSPKEMKYRDDSRTYNRRSNKFF